MGLVAGLIAIAAVFLLGAAAWGELVCGKGNSGKYLARVFGAAGIVTAFFGGNGIIQHRNDQLGVPFQTDNGELPQGDKEPLPVAAENQFVIKAIPDTDRKLQGARLLGTGAADTGA